VLIFSANVDDARKYLNSGFDGIAHTIDATVLVEGYREIVKNICK